MTRSIFGLPKPAAAVLAALGAAALLATAADGGFAASKKAKTDQPAVELTSAAATSDDVASTGSITQPPVEAAAPATQPAVTTAENAPAAVELQSKDQLQKAGVKRCLQMADELGRSTMAGSAQYAAASMWNAKQPDDRFSVSMIGTQFPAGSSPLTNAISGVFSTPTAEGKCDAAAVQVVPTMDSCSKLQSQILVQGKVLGNLAGVPILENAVKAQVMLLPGANNSCVVVALRTIYSD